MIILLLFLTLSLPSTLQEAYHNASSYEEYDKYVILEPNQIYTGGIGIYEGNVYINCRGSVIDLEGNLGIWVYAVHTKLTYSVNEEKYISLLEEAKNRHKLESMAACLVQIWWKSHRNKHIHTTNNALTKFQAQKKCMKVLREWRTLRRIHSITNMNSEYTMVELFHKQNELLQKRFHKIETKLKNV